MSGGHRSTYPFQDGTVYSPSQYPSAGGHPSQYSSTGQYTPTPSYGAPSNHLATQHGSYGPASSTGIYQAPDYAVGTYAPAVTPLPPQQIAYPSTDSPASPPRAPRPSHPHHTHTHARPRSHSQSHHPYLPTQLSVHSPTSHHPPSMFPQQMPYQNTINTSAQYPASPSRPFSCDQCALSFNRQHDLKRHRDTHTGDKPFLCNGGCGKTFTRKDALKRHQLVKQCGKDDDS